MRVRRMANCAHQYLPIYLRVPPYDTIQESSTVVPFTPRTMKTCRLMEVQLRLLSRNINIKIHTSTTSSSVLYECETWSVILSEESRWKVFGNKVLREIFWFKRDEITREWRRVHSEKLQDLCSSPNIIGVIK